MQRIRIFGLLALAGLAASGCGGPPPLAVVHGKVTFNGQPLAGVRVEFVPDDDVGPKVYRSTAVTQPDGTFDLMCENGKPGEFVGWHKVVVVTIRGGRDPNASVREHESQNNPYGSPPPAAINLAPYSSLTTTNQRHEIKPGENTIDLPLGG